MAPRKSAAPAEDIFALIGKTENIARASAAMELAAYASPDGAVAGQLSAVLAERDPQIRAAAMSSMQGLPDPFLAEHALGTLSDPLRSVRVEAGRVLARLPQ